jgi:hypothetical protein
VSSLSDLYAAQKGFDEAHPSAAISGNQESYHWILHRILTGAQYLTQNTSEIVVDVLGCTIE